MTYEIKRFVYRRIYNSWADRNQELQFGYSALLPMPSDLPVFLKLSLRCIALQDPENLVEVLVIPDAPSEKFREAYDSAKNSRVLPGGVKLLEMGRLDRIVAKFSNSPSTNHFLQIKNGVDSSLASHVLLHDADLFLPPGDYLRRYFEECVARDLSVMGLNPRRSIYIEECQHFVATWEMIAKVDWIKRFKPHLHRAQSHRRSNGELHKFDTTLLPQYFTESNELMCSPPSYDFVHVDHLISTYRNFCRGIKPLEDKRFRLLFIRLLIDALDDESVEDNSVPAMEDCIAGLKGQGSLVTYTAPDTISYYPGFRDMLERLMGLNVLEDAWAQSIRKNIIPFDEKFEWNATVEQK